MNEETNLGAEEFQINYTDTPPYGGRPNSPLLKCGLQIMTSFQRLWYGKWRRIKSHFTVKKYDKHYLRQVFKVHINNSKSC